MGLLKTKKLKGISDKTLSEASSMLDVDKLETGPTAAVKYRCYSLATGIFSERGLLSLAPSPIIYSPSGQSCTTFDESVGSISDDDSVIDLARHRPSLIDAAKAVVSPIKAAVSPITAAVASRIHGTMFIRTADLPTMVKSVHECRSEPASSFHDEAELLDFIHRQSSLPPLPTIDHDPNESWVALDDGNGNKAPLAEAAMTALVRAGLDAAMDQQMWLPNASTAKLIKTEAWQKVVFAPFDANSSILCPHSKGSKEEHDVLVWSGTFAHKYYGCDLPAIRCEAIVNMSPRNLANLLIDSSRVKEYNKMSIGRQDILVLHDSETCVTKVVVGLSKPPLLGKILELKSLLHMEELPGGIHRSGMVFVSRAVAHKEESKVEEDPKIVKTEMLMGANIIRAVEGDPNRCILISLNHLRSPMIPMMMAKRLGLSAAVNFINDIRALC